MKPGVAVRVAAARSLGRILRGGAWSNVVVEAETAGMAEDDRRLVRRLVFGTLRNLKLVDRELARHVRRDLTDTDPVVLDVLRIAAYELTVGSGQAHAAVDTAVEAVRELDRPRASGFVNAVLRNLLRKPDGPPPAGLALAHGVPDWFVEDLSELLGGADAAAAYLEASDQDAPRTARLRPGHDVPTGAGPTPLADVFQLPPGEVPDGAVIQDVASAAVAHALGDVAGTRVLDMAAAPGGKTIQIWDMGPDLLVACDVHAKRLRRARQRLEALGYPGPWVQADGRQLPFADATFDRVLLDAPCTGLGTLRRRPELRYRVNRQEVKRLAAMQHKMLTEAHRVLAPGGRIVYSVCTVTQAETVEVAKALQGSAPDLPIGTDIGPGRLLTPDRDGSDGMFISVIEKS